MPTIELTWDQQRLLLIRSRLKAAGAGGLLRELNKAMKAAAVVIRDDEKAAALTLPNTTGVHTGLRQSIADATTIRVSSSTRNPGVVVYTQEAKVRGRLGRNTNQPRGWRHPVFGNRNVWVQQIMSPGWWQRAAIPDLPQARQKIHDAIETIAQQIVR